MNRRFVFHSIPVSLLLIDDPIISSVRCEERKLGGGVVHGSGNSIPRTAVVKVTAHSEHGGEQHSDHGKGEYTFRHFFVLGMPYNIVTGNATVMRHIRDTCK